MEQGGIRNLKFEIGGTEFLISNFELQMTNLKSAI
jgi:hypothetical protein